jgi:hypothetical protein
MFDFKVFDHFAFGGRLRAMSNNLDAVQAIYEVFRKGDIPGILERLSEAVRWEKWTDNEAQKAGVPWLQSRIGKEGVAEFSRSSVRTA